MIRVRIQASWFMAFRSRRVLRYQGTVYASIAHDFSANFQKMLRRSLTAGDVPSLRELDTTASGRGPRGAAYPFVTESETLMFGKTYSAKVVRHREEVGSSSTPRASSSAASLLIIALRLRGKHKPTFTPHLDDGDNVIVDQRRAGGVHRPQEGTEGIFPPHRLSRVASRSVPRSSSSTAAFPERRGREGGRAHAAAWTARPASQLGNLRVYNGVIATLMRRSQPHGARCRCDELARTCGAA